MHGKLKFLFSISVICFILTHIFGLSIMFLLQCLIQGTPRSGPCFCRHRIVSLLMLGPLAGIPPAFRWLANSNWPFRVHLLGGGAFPASPAPVLWGDALWAAFKWLQAACPSHYSYKLIFLSSPQQRNQTSVEYLLAYGLILLSRLEKSPSWTKGKKFSPFFSSPTFHF